MQVVNTSWSSPQLMIGVAATKVNRNVEVYKLNLFITSCLETAYIKVLFATTSLLFFFNHLHPTNSFNFQLQPTFSTLPLIPQSSNMSDAGRKDFSTSMSDIFYIF
jgi:hypothetical protein